MLTKSEKLAQRIRELQDFIATRIKNDGRFAAINQQLEIFSGSLKAGKLTVQIVSNNLISAQALHNFLCAHKTLPESYQFHVTSLPESAIPTSSEFYQLVDCDILCLVVDLKQALSNSEGWFIQQASQTQIAKRFVIVERPEISGQSDQLIQASIAEIEAKIQSHSPEPSFQVIPLYLYPFYPNVQETTVDSNSQRELEQFCKPLEALVRRKPEDVLVKRIGPQVLFQVAQVERVYDMEAEALRHEMQQVEGKLLSIKQSDSTNELKEQVEQALEQINGDKEKFFRQVKLELNQSKAGLLDGFNRKSIIYKIQAFTDNLQPFVIKRGAKKYVHLKSDSAQSSADINIDMMHLCYSSLSQWAIQEWEKIYIHYGEGGVSHFFQKTYSVLNLIPSLKFRASLFQPDQDNTLFQRSLKDLVAGVGCESYYKEVSVGNYLIRQVRNQWMGIMFLLTFITMTGLSSTNRRDFVKNIFKPIFSFKSNPFLLTIVLAIPLCFVFLLLFYNYHNDSQHKLEDEAKKLKRELCSYYQSFAKISVEKLTQDLMAALEAEEERLRRILDSFCDRFKAHITEVTKNQLFFKNDLDNLNSQLKELDKAKADLQKLKRI
jgi:hypothetical protein